MRLPRTRREVADAVDAELRFHLETMAADLRAEGWPEAEAMQEAERRFGDVHFTRTYCRDEDLRREREARRMTIRDELWQDVRFAFRTLRASPGFAAAALLTLAIGIGANTAIFSVVRGVLLDPLPFAEPSRLVRTWHAHPADGIEQGAVSEPDFLDWKAETRLASSMGGYWYADGMSGMDLTGNGNPERISIAAVTDGFFQTLATPALLGRSLETEQHVPGRDRVVVLSHGFWSSRFGEDPSIIGRAITLNGEPFQVVGVMPPGFTYPAPRAIDAWIPLSYFGPDDIGRSRGSHFLGVIARLRPAATQQQFQSELSGIAARLAREHPENPGWSAVTTTSIRESIVGEIKQPIVVLMAAVALVLLVACVNIASLLLARATVRQQELAVRGALGASRGRIARQLLTESVTLSVLGGALGVALGYAASRGLATAAAGELPRASGIEVDGWVLAFTLALAIACGLFFGTIPAMQASHNVGASLRAGGRGAVGRGRQSLRNGLVVAEVALAVVLVIAAGLATKSFARLLAVEPGFDPENALVVTASVPDAYDETSGGQMGYYYRVLEAIRAIPGVRYAGSIRDLPTRGNGEQIRPDVPGRPTAPGEGPAVQLHHVSTDYFKALGTPLIEGRAFEMTDLAEAQTVLVVNEELVRRLWPGESGVGKAFRFGETEIPIIGVVANVRQGGLAEPVDPAAYIHVLQNFRSRMSIVVRTTGDPAGYANAVRQAIWSVDPQQTITSVATLESVMGSAVARPRLLAWLLGLFGVIGLTLGALGIFGVLAYTVNQRRQEIGLRVALGAQPRSVLTGVVRHGLTLAVAGVVVGAAGALLLTRWMQSLLFGIEASDPATFLQVIGVLLLSALLASWLPARRALAIDPVTALRYD